MARRRVALGDLTHPGESISRLTALAREILRGRMSQENVEIVHRFTEAYRSGDFKAALENLAPEIHYEVGQELPARRPDAVLGIWERWEREWEAVEIIPEEYIDVGDR